MKANRLIRIPLRSVSIGLATLVSMLASASAAHAHGGMAGPDELGPPLLTSGALGFACYWLVVLWPSAKNRRTLPDGPGSKTRRRTRSNGHPKARKPAAAKQVPRLKEVESEMRVETGRARGKISSMHKRLMVGILVAAIGAVVSATSAFAHGEAGDEPFLKDLTTAFYDVTISPTEIKVGEPVTITGSVRILETWPYTLTPPEKAYIMPVVPGPVFALKERTVNGQEAPGSFFVEKGGIYQFRMVMLGRNPGRWHVHPGIAVEGTGTLIGPGEWVTVQPSAAKFDFPVTLLSGQTINLNTYKGGFVWWWSFAGFLIGVVWMLYWTLTHRTVTNLAVTIQLGVNDDAPDIGLITPQDHMWMNLLAALTVIMLVVGWTYAAMKYPVRLPQQTDWFSPEFISSGEKMAEVHSNGATYDDATDTLVMNVKVKNLRDSPIKLKQYIMAMATFVNGTDEDKAKAGPHDYVGQLEVEPSSSIAPGETRDLTLKITSKIFSEERLIPLRDPQQFIAGLMRFENGQSQQELVVLRTAVIPTQFRSQYLP